MWFQGDWSLRCTLTALSSVGISLMPLVSFFGLCPHMGTSKPVHPELWVQRCHFLGNHVWRTNNQRGLRIFCFMDEDEGSNPRGEPLQSIHTVVYTQCIYQPAQGSNRLRSCAQIHHHGIKSMLYYSNLPVLGTLHQVQT